MKPGTFTKILFTVLVCGLPFFSHAIGGDGYGDGLKIKFDTTGHKYIRFMLWTQLWARYNQDNPGSMINNRSYNDQFDLALRSTRLLIYSQVTNDFMVLLHVGINNQTS